MFMLFEFIKMCWVHLLQKSYTIYAELKIFTVQVVFWNQFSRMIIFVYNNIDTFDSCLNDCEFTNI